MRAVAAAAPDVNLYRDVVDRLRVAADGLNAFEFSLGAGRQLARLGRHRFVETGLRIAQFAVVAGDILPTGETPEHRRFALRREDFDGDPGGEFRKLWAGRFGLARRQVAQLPGVANAADRRFDLIVVESNGVGAPTLRQSHGQA